MADDSSDGGGLTASPEQWDQYVNAIKAALAASSGFQRMQLQAQLDDAEKGRANAYKIAQLSAETSRYGVDVNARLRMAELKQQQAQFEATHGLDLAKAYTQFASTPDMMFARNDFINALGRVGQGGFPQDVTTEGQPHAKTWEDFQAIANLGTGKGGGGGGGGGGAAAGGGTADPRMTAANAVMKAIPPSDGAGHDDQDWAALSAIQALYSAGKPGSVARLGAARGKIALAGLARLGYDPATVLEDYTRAGVGQQSSRLA